MKKTIVIIILNICVAKVFGQFQFDRIPQELQQPVLEPGNYDYNNKSLKSNGDLAWVVYSDKNNNNIHADPKEKSEVLGSLKFMEKCYVVDQKDEWLKLMSSYDKESNDPLRVTNDGFLRFGEPVELGWVKKEHLLLWSDSPVHYQTRIHLKAFLLHKAEEIASLLKKKNKRIIKFYSDPNLSEQVHQSTIHNFYFVYKESNGNYLLGVDYRLNDDDYKDQILGWVDKNECKIWKTRMAIEPNFEKAAFEERKANDVYLMRAFKSPVPARNLANNLDLDKTEVLITPDPVTKSAEWRGEGAGNASRRYKGGVMRLPIFSNDADVFSSGVVGQITIETLRGTTDSIAENTYALILDDLKVKKQVRDNYNIFFVVEGTSEMGDVKASLAQSIKSVSKKLEGIPSVKYGYAVYRDAFVSQESKALEFMPLTKDRDRVSDGLSRIEFNNFGDNDGYTCQNFAFNESISKAGFNKNHFNLIIHVGNNPDLRRSKIRALQAESEHPKYLIADADIEKALSEYSINVYSFGNQKGDRSLNQEHASFMAKRIEQAAMRQFSSYKKIEKHISDFNIPAPAWDDSDNILYGGALLGALISTNGSVLEDVILQKIDEANNFNNEFWQEITNTFEYGSKADAKISQGTFKPSFAKLLLGFIEKSGRKWTVEDIQKILQQKYKLYKDAYIPKHIVNAKHPTYSTVLFFTEKDLDDFIDEMQRIKETVEEGSRGANKDQLKLYFQSLLAKYTGETYDKVNLKRISIEEMERLIQGISKEGYDLESEVSAKNVSELLKLKEEDLNNFLSDLEKKRNNLKDIYSQGSSYDFSFVSANGELYFWIPIEDTLIFNSLGSD